MFKRFFSSFQLSAVDQLESLHCLVQSVNSTSSTLQKRHLLAENPSCHSILKRIYNPHVRHYLSSKSVLNYIEKYQEPFATEPYQSLDVLLDSLSSRKVRGHEALKAVAGFYTTYCQNKHHKKIFWRVIDRNLKMGVSEKTVRHLLSDPKEFSPCAIKVALAHSLGKKKELDLTKEPMWYASQKLDGVRCISLIRLEQDTYDIQFLSRSGRKFYSLQRLANDLEKSLRQLNIKEDFVLDGEVCAYNGKENEDFGIVQSQIRRINEEMENPLYHVFDYIPLKSFLEGHGDMTFSQRQKRLQHFIDNASLKHVRMVNQKQLENTEQLTKMKKDSIQNGWEGLILRRDVAYEGKRTTNLLKVKEWEDAEYIVNGVETSFMRMPGTGENKCVLKSVNIKHRGNTVSVGSGFSMHERIEFAANPETIIGKAITVRYFSESENKNGTISLRFPTVKAIYDSNKRDT